MTREQKAYIAPFAAFMLLLAAIPLLPMLAPNAGSILSTAPQHVLFPLQTLICGALLLVYWKSYALQRPAGIGFTLAIAILIFAIWISPQWLFLAPRRFEGFDPTLFQTRPAVYAAVLALRFLRLVVVVPLLEEIFWRGFLLRDFIDRDFKKVPFGTFSPFSFGAVTLLFAFAHWGSNGWRPGPDFIPALFAGTLFNVVAYRTRSLSSCVIAHAATNLLLGLYIMQTRQWGFW